MRTGPAAPVALRPVAFYVEITTHEKAIHKITEIRQWLSERFPADDELGRRIADVVELLQHHAKGTKPQHRSHLSQMLAESDVEPLRRCRVRFRFVGGVP
jgi:hypothetical protein